MSRLRSCASGLALVFFVALPLDARAQDDSANDSVWTQAIGSAVADDPALSALAPSDVAGFCPRYTALDDSSRRAFWSNLMTEVARTESGGDPTRTRWLVFDSAIDRPAFRRGLFQISIEAAHSTRFNCAVNAGSDLADPNKNAACAVRIIESTIGADGAIAGAGRYWPSLAHRDRRTRIAAMTSSEAPCAADEALSQEPSPPH